MPQKDREWEKDVDRGKDAERGFDGPPLILGVYLAFRQLECRHAGRFLVTIDDLYRDVYIRLDAPETALSVDWFQKLDRRFRDVAFTRLVKQRPTDRLDVDSIYTGDSITFRFRSGWRPGLDVRKDKIVVSLPKPLAALAVTGTLLNGALALGNNSLDAILKYQQIQKQELEIEELHQKLRAAPEPIQQDLKQFLDLTQRHPNIEQVSVSIERGDAGVAAARAQDAAFVAAVQAAKEANRAKEPKRGGSES